MAISDNWMSTYTQQSSPNDLERPKSGDGMKKDLWSSMLDSVASGKRLPEKNILVLGKSSRQEKAELLLTYYPGGSPDSQKEFLEALSVDSAAKRGLDRHGSRQAPVANNFALGYTYYDVTDTDHEGSIRERVRGYAMLICGRLSCPCVSVSSCRSFAVIHPTFEASPDTTDDTEYTYCDTARLVTTMALAEPATRLDPTPTNPAGITGPEMQE